jgi:ribonuclease P protein component
VNFSFPSCQRVRQSKDFEQAFKNKGLANKWFIIYLLNSSHTIPRLGLVVSKRTVPKSVSRNFAKRLIREIFRLNSSNLPAVDFVVKVRRNLTKDSYIEARLALTKLMLSTNTL